MPQLINTTLRMSRVSVYYVLIALLLFLSLNVRPAQALGNLTSSSMTLGSTAPSTTGVNFIATFTLATAINGDTTSGDTDGSIFIRFPTNATTEPFTIATGSIASTDVTLGSGCTALASLNTLSITSAAGSAANNDTIQLALNQTSASGVAMNLAAGTTCTITIVNGAVDNPTKVATAGTADNYEVQFATQANGVPNVDVDAASTTVSIIESQAGSATVSNLLAFTVAAIASGTPIRTNNTTDVATTTGGSPGTAATIPWGTLTPNQPKQAGQTLTITTNAQNGFNLYVVQNTNLCTAACADDIDQFKDGARVDDGDASGNLWTSPAAVGTTSATFTETQLGHLAYGTSDTTVFAATEYAGIPTYAEGGATAPVTTGLACDATGTVSAQSCVVEYQVEIAPLQPAGSYTHTIQYILVPIY